MSLRTRIKQLIIDAALWGLLPYRLAVLLIKHGGLAHD